VTAVQELDIGRFQPGYLVAGRFTILDSPRAGGMALVFKARDENSGSTCAIKLPRLDANPATANLAFARELSALEDLRHENIVALIDAGRDEDDNYLALEWLESSLADRLRRSPAMDWLSFYSDLGRPVLSALAYAHRRNRAHRDLKPDNLLFDAHGEVKIIDFGIATSLDAAQIGQTLRHAGSVPYTPPEADDGFRSRARDAYSWSVIATSCLTGRLFADLGAFQSALAGLDASHVPSQIFQQATSANPASRYLTAVDLLADLDSFEANRSAKEPLVVTLEVSTRGNRMLMSHWPGKDQHELDELLSSDLSAGSAAQSLLVHGTQGLRVVGATLEAICRRVSAASETLRIEEVNVLGIERAEQFRREMPQVAAITYNVSSGAGGLKAAQHLRAYEARIRIAEAVHERDEERRRKERWLDCWSAILREKERQSRFRRRSFVYSQMRRDGRYYVASCQGEIDEDTIPESLIIQKEGAPVLLFKVLDVFFDELVLELQGSYGDLVPMHGGTLETNHVAERRAILRQRNALDAVRQDSAASPRLKELLCSPSLAEAPSLSGLPDEISGLSKDKYEVLERALGVSDILAVEGPPGTGKTTLIAELIDLYLARNPGHRILLASQTHIALDHVLSKLVDKGMGHELIRIHGDQAQKVSAKISPLTLENKTRQWIEATETRARAYLETEAQKIGAKRDHVEIAVLGRQRRSVASQIHALTVQLVNVQNVLAESNSRSVSASQDQRQDAVDQTATALDEQAQIAEVLEALKTRKRRIEERITSLGEFGAELLAASDLEEVNWIELLNPDQSPDSDRFVEKVKLQMQWLSRLGPTRDFLPAVLGHARVVSGTCVGLGGLLTSVRQRFDLCIIDESSKATPTEALIPMAHSRKWILVGDPKQLPPFEDREVLEAIEGFTHDEVRRTLLDIFLRDAPPACRARLSEQRRMASSIGELISEVFYGGDLVTVRGEEARHSSIRKLFPKAVTWFSTSGARSAETPQPGFTFKNVVECNFIAELLRRINGAVPRGSEKPIEVAVIAAYSAQVRAIRLQMQSSTSSLQNIVVEVNSVDAFQGRDADICIYSVTRSNSEFRLGFQREERRLNVALSRGRDALLIVGDENFCRSIHKNNPFLDVLSYIDNDPVGCEVIRIESS
jgi:serine/threonine protein kinase